MESTENKVMGVLSYISVLVLIPILIGQKDGFVRHHANQGLNLCIIGIACRIVMSIVGWIPIIGWLVGIVVWAISVGVFILAVLGIIYALQGKTKSLPIVGNIKLLG